MFFPKRKKYKKIFLVHPVRDTLLQEKKKRGEDSVTDFFVPREGNISRTRRELIQKKKKEVGEVAKIFHLSPQKISILHEDPRFLLITSKREEAWKEGRELMVYLSPYADKKLYRFLRDAHIPFRWVSLENEEHTFLPQEGDFMHYDFLFFLPLVHEETGIRIPFEEVAKHIRSWKKYHPSLRNRFHVHGSLSEALFEEKLNFYALGADSLSFAHTLVHPFPLFSLLSLEEFSSVSFFVGEEKFVLYGLSFLHDFFEQKRYLRERLQSQKDFFLKEWERQGLPHQALIESESPHIQAFSFSRIPHDELVLRLEQRGFVLSFSALCKDTQYHSFYFAQRTNEKEGGEGNDFAYLRFHPKGRERDIVALVQNIKEVKEYIEEYTHHLYENESNRKEK